MLVSSVLHGFAVGFVQKTETGPDAVALDKPLSLSSTLRSCLHANTTDAPDYRKSNAE